ncbi:MAG: cytochrome-c peroxidase [Verrucomicrobiae bacterium]|nr:cytochrome-c peroxidase [Verrucomicrobiae bacterium]
MKTRPWFSSSQAIAAFVRLVIFSAAMAGVASAEEGAISKEMLSYFAPLPGEMPAESNPITEEKVALGRSLYFDPRLSLDGKTSCNSCHVLDAYGVESGRNKMKRNVPTVYNAALHVGQYWDGRAADVEEHAKRAVVDSAELAMPDIDAMLEVLNSIPGYVEAFASAFPDNEEPPMSLDHFGKAVGAFERKLVTPGRFDQFLGGDEAALTAREKAGLVEFVQVGCVACHSGQALGGKLYQKLGLVRPWPQLKDNGRFGLTGEEADRFVFKVPGLRNVAKTAPYLHDGSIKSLEQTVEWMAWHEIGQYLDPSRVRSIVAFLATLTGELPPQELIGKPELPADGATTAGILANLQAGAWGGKPVQ